MELTIEDTIPNRSKEPELIRVLEKILVERCGLAAGVRIIYKEAGPRKYLGDDELKIRMRVKDIVLGARLENAGEGMQAETAGGAGGRNLKSGDGAGQADRKTFQGKPEGSGFGGGNRWKDQNVSAGPAAPGGESQGFGATHQAGEGGAAFRRRGDFKRGEFRRGGDYGRTLKQSDDPDVLYGRDFDEEAIPIEDIIGEMGEVTIRGKVLKTDSRQIRNERTIVMFDVTDFTDTMTVKLFARNDYVKELTDSLKSGTFVKIKGVATLDKFDHELTIGSLTGIRRIPDFTTVRKDTALHKRVELHCHTKMSDFDGVSEAKDIVKRAFKWGHRAIAITDHGVVQGFTDAFHVWQDL